MSLAYCFASLFVAKKPIILLLFSAGPLNISVAKSSDMVAAIVSCFFPGQGTGEALRRVLMADADGSVLSPAGRLPYTWPASLSQVSQMWVRMTSDNYNVLA